MPIPKWPSLVEMFFDQAARFSGKPFLYKKQDGAFVGETWGEVAVKVATLAAALKGLGVKPGDRVMLVSENSPNWLISDMAIMTAGAVTVPSYTTYTVNDYLHVLDDSGANFAIVSSRSLAQTFFQAAHQTHRLQHAIVMEDPQLEQNINCPLHKWDDIMAAADGDVAAARANISVGRSDLACLIYTSGTGGAPKGVMMPHGAILHNCEGAAEVVRPLGLDNNRFLSFLPLSHAYEHSAGQFLPISIGASIYYAEGIDKLGANMEEVSPTFMVVVPRLFEMLRSKISRAMEKEGGLKYQLFQQAIHLGSKRYNDPRSMTFKENIQNRFLNVSVRKKIQGKFGGKMKALVSGGAPLATDVGLFFASLGLPLLQGYGQTEAGPVISVNPPHDPRMHTVGKLLANTEVEIAEDGEILVRGELMMQGYWRNEAETNKTIIDGWLHTGDVGRFDKDGYLEITDRKKDIIVNDKGDNVSPQRIEGLLSLEDEIAQALVYGDKRPHLVGLLVPDAEWLRDWCRANKKSLRLNEIYQDPDLIKALSEAVSRVNAPMANLEKVRRFAIAPEAFTVENEQMTPTLKIRRHVLNAHYKKTIEGLY